MIRGTGQDEARGVTDRVREDFERFVATSTDDLLRTAYLVLWDLSSAEDVVQECLLRVARRWPRVRAMEHPGAYARRIVVNGALERSSGDSGTGPSCRRVTAC